MDVMIQKIIVDEKHMDQMSVEFNKCAAYVGEIISVIKTMDNITEESYKGSASSGLSDYFNVLKQHLDVLKLSYKQLGDYTNMVKEVSLDIDKFVGSSFEINYKGGVIK